MARAVVLALGGERRGEGGVQIPGPLNYSVQQINRSLLVEKGFEISPTPTRILRVSVVLAKRLHYLLSTQTRSERWVTGQSRGQDVIMKGILEAIVGLSLYLRNLKRPVKNTHRERGGTEEVEENRQCCCARICRCHIQGASQTVYFRLILIVWWMQTTNINARAEGLCPRLSLQQECRRMDIVCQMPRLFSEPLTRPWTPSDQLCHQHLCTYWVSTDASWTCLNAETTASVYACVYPRSGKCGERDNVACVISPPCFVHEEPAQRDDHRDSF